MTPSVMPLTCAVLMAYATSSIAQGSSSQRASGKDRGFVGIGVFTATDDASSRVRGAHDVSSLWTVEAGFFATGRLGVGAELSNLGTAISTLNALCCIGREEQKETSLLGVLRGRAWRRKQLAVDLVAGGGVLFQHRESTFTDRFVPGSTMTTVEERRSPAFAIGVDLPVSIAPHVAIAPQIRLYALQRGTLADVRASSERFAIGVSGRVPW